MSNPEFPSFDVLFSQKQPFVGFGPLEEDSPRVELLFGEVVRQAQTRVSQEFDVDEFDGEKLTTALDDVVAEMWTEGWDPQLGDVNLFARDFGALTMDALLRETSGHAIFRSSTDLSNASVYWPQSLIEAFPFHKAQKCLMTRDGESFSQFFRGVVQFVAK